ncbi:MAG: hypothetical protein ABEJ96_06920, partial [Thiohalorhabdaceae bacterium]
SPGSEDEYEADADSEPTTTMAVEDTTTPSEGTEATEAKGPDDSVDTDWDAGVEADYPVLGGTGGEDDELPSLEARSSAPETLS